MSYEEDSVDAGIRDLAKETAEEIAAESDEATKSLEEAVINADGDPCNSYEWSIIFLLLFIIAMLVMIFHMVTIFMRRANLSAFDILTLALYVSTFIQFGPMISQVLHSGHGVYHFSQSGCKLLFYTDYGMRHVISFLVFCFFLYAYLILYHSFDPENLDRRLKGNVAWLILLLFGIEGLFGMAPAIYVDVGPLGVHSCIWTPTINLSVGQIIAMELILRPLTPYIIPLLLLAYPLFNVTRAVKGMDGSKVKSTLYSCVIVAWTYLLMNLPYAILLVTESIGHATGTKDFSWVTVCNFKWAFFLLHQAWFLLLPIAMLALEVDKGNKPVGSDLAIATWNKAKMIRLA